MKQAAELIDLNSGYVGQPTNQVDQRNEIQGWFDSIFMQVCTCCSGWKSAIPNDKWLSATKRSWFVAFAANRNSLNDKAIAKGLRKLQKKKQVYLPPVEEFIELCMDNPYPPLEEAKAEILAGRKPYSSKFIEYLASRTKSSALHPTTEKSQGNAEFKIEYDKAAELAKTGFFEQGEVKRIKSKPMDKNLAHYLELKSRYPKRPKLAEDFLANCKKRGINIDVKSRTVTYPKNYAQMRVRK